MCQIGQLQTIVLLLCTYALFIVFSFSLCCCIHFFTHLTEPQSAFLIYASNWEVTKHMLNADDTFRSGRGSVLNALLAFANFIYNSESRLFSPIDFGLVLTYLNSVLRKKPLDRGFLGHSQLTLNSPNRYSMPVAGLATRTHNDMPDLTSVLGLGQINTTGFLFGDDDEKPQVKKDQNLTTSPGVKSYLQMNATDDKFPILVRRDDYPGLVSYFNVFSAACMANGSMQLSASSAALDLALSQSPGPESQTNGWPSVARHRPSQHSLPLNTFSMHQHNSLNNGSPASERQTDVTTDESPNHTRQLHRHSMELKFSPFGENPLIQTATPSAGATQSRPALASLQSSYSTNDLPTMKSSNGLGTIITPPKTHAQQHFHNHNASLGRIPPHAVNNRHSRELSGGDSRGGEQGNHFQSMQSGLHGNAAPFGPPLTTAGSSGSTPIAVTPPGISPFAPPAYYGGYGVQMMNMGMTPIHMGNPMQTNNQLQAYQPQNVFAGYQNYGNMGRFPDSQARVIQQRRVQNGEGAYSSRSHGLC